MQRFATLRGRGGWPGPGASSTSMEDVSEACIPSPSSSLGLGGAGFHASERVVPRKRAASFNRIERAQTMTSLPVPATSQRRRAETFLEPHSAETEPTSTSPTALRKSATSQLPPSKKRRESVVRSFFSSVSSRSGAATSDSSVSSSHSPTASLSAATLWDQPTPNVDVVTHGAAMIAALVRLKTIPFQEWSVNDVCMWLDLLCMDMYIPAFRRNEVTGQYLSQIDKHDLRAMGMKSIGHRKRFERRLKMLIDGDEGALDEPSTMERRGGKNSSSLWSMSPNPAQQSNAHQLKIASFSISTFSFGASRKEREEKKQSKKMLRIPNHSDGIASADDIILTPSAAGPSPNSKHGTIDGLIESLTPTPHYNKSAQDLMGRLSGSEGKMNTKRKHKYPCFTITDPTASRRSSVRLMIDHWEMLSNSEKITTRPTGAILHDEAKTPPKQTLAPPSPVSEKTSPRSLKSLLQLARGNRSRSNSLSLPEAKGHTMPDTHQDVLTNERGGKATKSDLALLPISTLPEATQHNQWLSTPKAPREKTGTQIILRLKEELHRKAEEQTQSLELEENSKQIQSPKQAEASLEQNEVENRVGSEDKEEKKLRRSHKKKLKASREDSPGVSSGDSSTPKKLRSKSLRESKKENLSSSRSAISSFKNHITKDSSHKDSSSSTKKRILKSKSLGKESGKKLKKKLKHLESADEQLSETMDSHKGRKRKNALHRSGPEEIPNRRRADTIQVDATESSSRREDKASAMHMSLAHCDLAHSPESSSLGESMKKQKKLRKSAKEDKKKEKGTKRENDKTTEKLPTKDKKKKKSDLTRSDPHKEKRRKKDDLKKKKKKKTKKTENTEANEVNQVKDTTDRDVKDELLQTSTLVVDEEKQARLRKRTEDMLDAWWWHKRSQLVMVKCIWGDETILLFVPENIRLHELRHVIRTKLNQPPGWKFELKSRTNLHRHLVTLDKTPYLHGALQYHRMCRDPNHPLGGAAMRLYVCEI